MKRPSPDDADDFEARVQQQAIREIPQSWRTEILATARSAASRHALSTPSARSAWQLRLSLLASRASALLWPSPKAWAGLALAWLVILVFNHATINQPTDSFIAVHRASPEMRMAKREEERVLAELLGQTPGQPVAERPKSTRPRPRSELKSNTFSA